MKHIVTNFVRALEGLGFGNPAADINGADTVDEVAGWLDYLRKAAKAEQQAAAALRELIDHVENTVPYGLPAPLLLRACDALRALED